MLRLTLPPGRDGFNLAAQKSLVYDTNSCPRDILQSKRHNEFVADHQFSFSAVDQQCGAMPILKRMMEFDPLVRFEGATDVVMVDDGSLAMGSIGALLSRLWQR